MNNKKIKIEWPDGKYSLAEPGDDWLIIANDAGIKIPTGCLSGSCGACEIEVNGETIRACITAIPKSNSKKLKVDFASDPFW